MNWTPEQYERFKNRGVKDFTHQPGNRVIVIPDVEVHYPKIPHEEPGQLKEMKQLLMLMKIDFVTEYKFLADRKFRFDIYFELNGFRVGAEYDGIISTRSRHTSLTGFSNDTEKTNLAQLNGFIVLRYTALTHHRFASDVNFLMRK